jgi:hypothetical protein
MEVSGKLQVPAALLHGKSPWYPLDKRLGGPQSRCGCGEDKNSKRLKKHFVTNKAYEVLTNFRRVKKGGQLQTKAYLFFKAAIFLWMAYIHEDLIGKACQPEVKFQLHVKQGLDSTEAK